MAFTSGPTVPSNLGPHGPQCWWRAPPSLHLAISSAFTQGSSVKAAIIKHISCCIRSINMVQNIITCTFMLTKGFTKILIFSIFVFNIFVFKINRFWQPSQSDVRSFQYHEIENFNLVIKINREIDFGKRLIFFNRGCLGQGASSSTSRSSSSGCVRSRDRW